MTKKTPVIFIHDAAIDEYMATVLLTTMEHIDFRGIVIVDADCIAGPAMDVADKILKYIKREHIPLTLSSVRGWNAFPWLYREDCIKQGQIETLKKIEPRSQWPWYPSKAELEKLSSQGKELSKEELEFKLMTDYPQAWYPSGDEFLHNQLKDAVKNKEPITMLVSCPLTPLKNLLENKPHLKEGISHLIWMGGAVDFIDGNLDPATLPAELANPFAEWNAFWDPVAVDWIFKNTGFPITMFPLNVTNQAKITNDFLERLAVQARHHDYSRLAFQSYMLVSWETFYDMWDVVTTTYLAKPGIFEPPTPMKLECVTEGFLQGTIWEKPGVVREIDVIKSLKNPKHPREFYDYVLEQFKR